MIKLSNTEKTKQQPLSTALIPDKIKVKLIVDFRGITGAISRSTSIYKESKVSKKSAEPKVPAPKQGLEPPKIVVEFNVSLRWFKFKQFRRRM